MWSSARTVSAGDTVIVWLTRDIVQPLTVTPGKDFNTKFGNYRQADFVGVPYGSKVTPRAGGGGRAKEAGRGFIHILRPTPELWTMALPHRTQILYLADIAFVVSWLGIRRGSRVIEAGTGSASFSHSVARTIGSSGHLYSYEFHEARFTKAKEEFTRHGMDDTVTIQHRNVCKDGFTVVDEVEADLPAPWEAVEHAKKALRKDRPARICCFSPCIEQVLRTVNALNDAGFTEITTHETLLRPIEVFQSVPAPLPVSALSEKLKIGERRREEKRVRQIRANELVREREKRKREEEEGGDGEGGEGQDANAKRARTAGDDGVGVGGEEMDAVGEHMDVDPEAATDEIPTISLSAAEEPAAGSAPTPLPTQPQALHPPPDPRVLQPTRPSTTLFATEKINVCKALPEVRGHTSYLTFACLVPSTFITSCAASASGEVGLRVGENGESSSDADGAAVSGVGSRMDIPDPEDAAAETGS